MNEPRCPQCGSWYQTRRLGVVLNFGWYGQGYGPCMHPWHEVKK